MREGTQGDGPSEGTARVLAPPLPVQDPKSLRRAGHASLGLQHRPQTVPAWPSQLQGGLPKLGLAGPQLHVWSKSAGRGLWSLGTWGASAQVG